MMNDLNEKNHITELFTTEMAGGAFAYRAEEGHELLFANENLIQLFECEDYEEFSEFVGNSFNGIVNETPLRLVAEDMEQQIMDSQTNFGYVFYNIRTKKGNVRRVVNHFTKLTDKSEGEIFCAFLYLHRHDNVGSDFDSVTGLYGKLRFHKYVSKMNKKFIDRLSGENALYGEEGLLKPAADEYAIIYLNLVNFKLLNIERGADEGDACLKVMADTLRECYQDSFVARISGDHFAIFTKKDKVYEKTTEAVRRFCETYGNQFDVIGKFGIYELEFGLDFDVENALSMAKVACDFIKHDSTRDVAVYTESLEEEVKTTEYVVGKIDEALKNEWVRVYYQPVIRSLTGSLCGMESLARWDDPVIGFLPPHRFIEALERERCIHKLDSYIVEKVCETLHERIMEKKPVVPVSVNFSRLDFLMCDMLAVVEQAVEKYDVPRDYIHIEITESMLASDEELMQRVIQEFRDAGYEIWMDDFGSGYSSLTLLKDFHFDTLKMDMRFLTPFTEKSKNVMCSVVTMAKDIGIKTLAEGVETAEQLEFLKSIGCGMIQGYYYGKPQPIEDTYAHVAEQFIPIESRRWRHFYEVAGFNVRQTDLPLELVEDDGKNFKTLFMNQSYQSQFLPRGVYLAPEELDKRIYQTKSPLVRVFRKIADRLEQTGEEETFYYTENGNYIRFKGQCIAKNGGRFLIKGSLVNISIGAERQESDRLDSKLRELNLLFEDVYLLNLSEKTVIPLFREFQYVNQENEKNTFSLKEGMDIITNEQVFPAEKIRCHEFLDYFSLRDRIDQSGKGYISDVFHMRQFDGSYKARELILMRISGTDGNEFLYCMKPYILKFVEKSRWKEMDVASLSEETEKVYLSKGFGTLWNNVIWNSELKCFWKDRKRRIRGVSQAFLEFYGFESIEEVIGKTDEEMHWLVDGEHQMKDELDILNKGECFRGIMARSIAKGAVHRIVCSKMPVYHNGEIIGLMGYFEDEERMASRFQNISRISKIDKVTGLMNVHAFLDAMLDYALEYREHGQDYGLALFYNRNQDRIRKSYGDEFSDKVLKKIADVIRRLTGQTCVVARTRENVFALLTHIVSKHDFTELAEAVRTKAKRINAIDGNPVTIRLECSVKFRSDQNIIDENIYELALEEVLEDF